MTRRCGSSKPTATPLPCETTKPEEKYESRKPQTKNGRREKGYRTLQRMAGSIRTMDSVGVCRRRRFVFLRRAIYDDLKGTPLPRPPCSGAHTGHIGTPIAQAHRTSVRGVDNVIWERERENTVFSGTFAKFSQSPEMKHHLLGTSKNFS